MWEQLLYELRNILADLYTDSATAKRVAADADLPVVMVDFEQPVYNVWSEIVRQAEIRGEVRRLIAVVLREYPEGPNSDKLRRLAVDIARHHITFGGKGRNGLIPFFPHDGDDRRTDSERLVALEVKVELLFLAVGGLYVGLFILGLLVVFYK